MGIYIPNFSRCSGPGKPSECGGPAKQAPKQKSKPEPKNPDPARFKIIRYKEVSASSCALEVQYEDVVNYEGRKILVYAYPLEMVLAQKRLDPHFCEHQGCIPPFARFEPTSTGWLAALFSAQWIGTVGKQ
jgi:hypothetical protein